MVVVLHAVHRGTAANGNSTFHVTTQFATADVMVVKTSFRYGYHRAAACDGNVFTITTTATSDAGTPPTGLSDGDGASCDCNVATGLIV